MSEDVLFMPEYSLGTSIFVALMQLNHTVLSILGEFRFSAISGISLYIRNLLHGTHSIPLKVTY